MTVSQTDNLSLPFIMPSQAQKHVAHNEALLALDAVVQLHIISRIETAPPATSTDGNRYLVPIGATGDFNGKDGRIAALQDGVYQFYFPQTGWVAYVSSEDRYIYFDGTQWVEFAGNEVDASFQTLGINASADTINRLVLSSEASLFNHQGNGHQLKINKASSSDTASLIFQTAFSGRAEFGLAGDDHFRIKTSPDGAIFYQSITADSTNGFVSIGDISPTANLTVANQIKVADPATSSALDISADNFKTSLISTLANGELEISQAGSGIVNFKINDQTVLKLEDTSLTVSAPIQLSQYQLATLPSPSPAGQIIYIAGLVEGSCLAFSNGAEWLRSEDRSPIS